MAWLSSQSRCQLANNKIILTQKLLIHSTQSARFCIDSLTGRLRVGPFKALPSATAVSCLAASQQKSDALLRLSLKLQCRIHLSDCALFGCADQHGVTMGQPVGGGACTEGLARLCNSPRHDVGDAEHPECSCPALLPHHSTPHLPCCPLLPRHYTP